eukprot:2039933-Prymnesium_polylepis.1
MCLGSHRVTIRREKRAQTVREAAGRAGVRVRRRIGIRSALESLGLSRLRVLWGQGAPPSGRARGYAANSWCPSRTPGSRMAGTGKD